MVIPEPAAEENAAPEPEEEKTADDKPEREKPKRPGGNPVAAITN